jgi:hypothetical protein
MHVNPSLATKGLVMVYNPLKEAITRKIKLPLYYTGLTKEAKVRTENGKTATYQLNRDYSIELTVQLPSEGYTWLVVE